FHRRPALPCALHSGFCVESGLPGTFRTTNPQLPIGDHERPVPCDRQTHLGRWPHVSTELILNRLYGKERNSKTSVAFELVVCLDTEHSNRVARGNATECVGYRSANRRGVLAFKRLHQW